MATGTYLVDNGFSGVSTYGNGVTMVNYIKSSSDIIVKTIKLKSPNSGGTSWTGKMVIYGPTGTKVYETTTESVAVSLPNTLYDLGSAGAGYLLTANVNYYVGYYQATSGSCAPGIDSAGLLPSTLASSPSFATITYLYNRTYIGAGDSSAWSGSTYTLNGGFTFDAPPTPTVPTNIATLNSPVPNGNPPVLSWTHNHINLNPQTQYQIRYRKIDT